MLCLTMDRLVFDESKKLKKPFLLFFLGLMDFLGLKCAKIFYLSFWSLGRKLENFKYFQKNRVHVHHDWFKADA